MSQRKQNQQYANPDDRSDNVEKLQEMVQNTIQNLESAHDTMQFSEGEAKQQIIDKNKRREESINAMRNEIKDEARHQQDQKK
ncbi:small acid-soluble spore protein Tlp [Pontibacillus sp. HMF3514]|uniref:small acid-soluble spore protein Tlp n=1 Tax=Pontibacillus sp. HMF3514 TaxID=2692425 RepID=UPI00131FF7E1|nr:small acid-soluble spore protein Tlp [Pontibacillus sp. HMF3514]QHE52311.1 small acid-soluble spore protein Tlp [Pontibacillus sp. HMF3514]